MQRLSDTQHRRLAQLLAVTDIYAWHDLRHEAGLGREETEVALRELVGAITVVNGTCGDGLNTELPTT